MSFRLRSSLPLVAAATANFAVGTLGVFWLRQKGQSGRDMGSDLLPERKTAHLLQQMGGWCPKIRVASSLGDRVDLSSAAGRSAVSGARDAAP